MFHKCRKQSLEMQGIAPLFSGLLQMQRSPKQSSNPTAIHLECKLCFLQLGRLFLQTPCFCSRAGGSMQTAAPGQTARIAVRQPRSRADGPAQADLRDTSCNSPPGAAAGCRSWRTEFPGKRIRFNCALWSAEVYNLY